MISVPTARTALVALVHELGIMAPGTAVVHTRGGLRKWLSGKPFPVVLKTDESYGGRGVRIVDSFTEAERARRALSTPPSLRRAIKRAIVNRDMNYIMPCLCRSRPRRERARVRCGPGRELHDCMIGRERSSRASPSACWRL